MDGQVGVGRLPCSLPRAISCSHPHFIFQLFKRGDEFVENISSVLLIFSLRDGIAVIILLDGICR